MGMTDRAPVALLALERIGHRFGDRAAVDGVSLELRPGRVLGLLGPNGSGKSTLLRIAAGLLRPDAGRVTLDGRDLAGIARGEIARRIAVVPQGAELPADFLAWDVVMAGRTPHLGRFGGPGPRDAVAARRALARVGAEHLADRRVGELSGGERQRIVIARALAQEPGILLLDEPTAHLDLPHQVAALDVVRQGAASGLAALGVFHDLGLAAEFCDDLALLRDGRIVAAGAPAEVLVPDVLEEVYGVRVPVTRHPESGRPAVLTPPAAEYGAFVPGAARGGAPLAPAPRAAGAERLPAAAPVGRRAAAMSLAGLLRARRPGR